MQNLKTCILYQSKSSGKIVSSVQLSSVYLAIIHYEVTSHGKGSSEETMGLFGPESPRYIKKGLQGLMDHIDCLIQLPLNITRCFPYFP